MRFDLAAYNRGRADARAGHGPASSPYDYNIQPEMWRAWRRGWEEEFRRLQAEAKGAA